jgi:hypothetical protein
MLINLILSLHTEYVYRIMTLYLINLNKYNFKIKKVEKGLLAVFSMIYHLK